MADITIDGTSTDIGDLTLATGYSGTTGSNY